MRPANGLRPWLARAHHARLTEEALIMDSTHIDALARVIGAHATRRTALALLSALLSLPTGAGARKKPKRRKKKKCRRCGPCRRCKRGRCRPKTDGTVCGDCATCVAGACVAGCPGNQVCQDGACACPPGQKVCQGDCIAQNDCCGACPEGQTCCTNIGECKDIRNDPDFCGQCLNGQCPGSAFCANGECGLSCDIVAAPCLSETCFCGERIDPAHSGQNVCTELAPFTCGDAKTCTTDADCAPGTLGFREVCVRGLCPDKNVCTDPCA